MSILLILQQSLEEPFGSVGIAPGLDEDIEHNAILIDGAPEILQHALDPNEDLVRVPLVSWSWPAASQAIGESRVEFHAPASHRLVGDDDAALSQDQLDIARNRRMRTRPIQAIKAAGRRRCRLSAWRRFAPAQTCPVRVHFCLCPVGGS